MENILRIQFSGRLRRNRFCPTYILICVISLVLRLLVSLAEEPSIDLVLAALVCLASLYLTLVGLGLGVRRLHDTQDAADGGC